MGFVFGGVSGLSDRGVTFGKIGNGGPKKVNILRVGRRFPSAASLMSGSGVYWSLSLAPHHVMFVYIPY